MLQYKNHNNTCHVFFFSYVMNRGYSNWHLLWQKFNWLQCKVGSSLLRLAFSLDHSPVTEKQRKWAESNTTTEEWCSLQLSAFCFVGYTTLALWTAESADIVSFLYMISVTSSNAQELLRNKSYVSWVIWYKCVFWWLLVVVVVAGCVLNVLLQLPQWECMISVWMTCVSWKDRQIIQ